MISVLLPSRKRLESLEESINSLRNTANSPTNLEILVACDPDDVPTFKKAKKLVDYAFQTDARYGYSNLHWYYNELSDASTAREGDWKLLWNDDAVMTTRGWDDIISDVTWPYVVADLQSELSDSGHCCFPAVRYEAIEAVGGFSPWTNHCDTFWQDIGRSTGKIKVVDIFVNHKRFDITGDHKDETYDEGQQGYRSDHYNSPEVRAKIAESISKIRRLA